MQFTQIEIFPMICAYFTKFSENDKVTTQHKNQTQKNCRLS